MIEITKLSDGQLSASIDGKRVALFSNSVALPLNFLRGVKPHDTMLVAIAVVEWLTDNVPENIPPEPQSGAVGQWVWADQSPELGLAPLAEESTAQATATHEAENVTDG